MRWDIIGSNANVFAQSFSKSPEWGIEKRSTYSIIHGFTTMIFVTIYA